MRYLFSDIESEERLYWEYADIVSILAAQHIHISNAKDLARYIRENHLENKFTFTNGFEQFCKDAELGYYDDNIQAGSNMITKSEYLYQRYGVRSFRELVHFVDLGKLDKDVVFRNECIERTYDDFRKSVLAGYYDYDNCLWTYMPQTIEESLQSDYGVHSYRELVARIDREGLEAVYGTHTVDFPEGSYESFRRAVLAGKYDEE